MIRAFKTRGFMRVMRKSGLSDATLCNAIAEMRRGLVDSDLGGHVLKKRVPLPGMGKRGSTRTLVATNRGDRWFFLYGFKKNERSNVTDKELEGLQKLAADLLGLAGVQLDRMVELGELEEICHGGET